MMLGRLLPAGGDSTVTENWLSYKTLPDNPSMTWMGPCALLSTPAVLLCPPHGWVGQAQSSRNESGLRSFLFYQGEAKKVLSGVFTHYNSLWQGLFWGKMVTNSEAKRTFSGVSEFLLKLRRLKIPQAPSPCSVPTLSLQYPLMNNRMKGFIEFLCQTMVKSR